MTTPVADFETEESIVESAVEQLGETLGQGARNSDHLMERLLTARQHLNQQLQQLERWT